MVLRNALGAMALDATVTAGNALLTSIRDAVQGVLKTRPDSLTVTPATISTNGVIVDGSTDVLNYPAVRVQLTGTFVATVSWEASIDGVNWFTQTLQPSTPLSTSGPSSTANTTGLYSGAVRGRYFRVRSTSYTSGTITVAVLYSTTADNGPVSLANSGNAIGSVGVNDPDTVATGTLTANDAVVAAPTGNGALLTGASTAGSTVTVAAPGGDSSWNAQLTGTFGSGTVYFEASFDGGTSWSTVNGRQTGIVNTNLGYSTTTAGAWRGNTSGATHVRVRLRGATAPSIAVNLRVANGVGAIFLNASLPSGTNDVGNIKYSVSPVGVYNISGLGQTADLGSTANYSSVQLHMTGNWTGTLQFQSSLDGVTYFPVALINSANGTTSSYVTANALYYGEVGGRYFKVVSVLWTTGTATVTAGYSTAPKPVTNATWSSPSGKVTSKIGLVTTGASVQQTIYAGAQYLQELTITNTSATPAYVKLYDKITNATIGTDIPRVIVPIAAYSAVVMDWGPNGKQFLNGIVVLITGGIGNADSSNPPAGVYIDGGYV